MLESQTTRLSYCVHRIFGWHHEGLVTFLVYAPDDLVLVVRIQWLGD